jgi:hypothetical protein
MAFTATKDLILPSTVTGSRPRPRWYTMNLLGRPLDTAMMDPWFREQFTDAHEVVVTDQLRAGLDILTTGDYHLDEDVAGRSVPCSIPYTKPGAGPVWWGGWRMIRKTPWSTPRYGESRSSRRPHRKNR